MELPPIQIEVVHAQAQQFEQNPRNAMSARVWAAFSDWASVAAANASFHCGNDKGRRSRSAFSSIRAMPARVGLSPERFQPAKDLPAPAPVSIRSMARFAASKLRAAIPIPTLLLPAPAPSGKRPTQCW
jgi:hypothetical protein